MVLPASRTYGRKHKAERERLRPLVDAGEAYCTELLCLENDRWIQPGSPWHLAHDRASGPGRYLGPAHERCNTSEGGRWLALQRQLADQPEPEPSGYVL